MSKTVTPCGMLQQWRRFYIIALVLFVFSTLLYFSHREYKLPEQAYHRMTHIWPTETYMPPNLHPIDILYRRSKAEATGGFSQDSQELNKAAFRYRKARGRHPPPDFDKWWLFAKALSAQVPERWFDQIYTDLEPFWGLPAANIREMAGSWHNVISVRDGKASLHSNSSSNDDWLHLWMSALQQMESHLPDVDLAFNDYNEPRVIVPWDDMAVHLRDAAATKHTSKPSRKHPIFDDFSSYPSLAEHRELQQPWKDSKKYWLTAREACPPTSAARNSTLESDLTVPANFNNQPFAGSYHGYVANWTLARSPCENPAIRSLHGALIAPTFRSTSTKLFPMLSGSKITGINNDILVPGAEYLLQAIKYIGENDPVSGPQWREKKNKAFWRGPASGGSHNANNWARFHRYRLVSMLNSSQVTAAEGLHYPWDPPISAALRSTFLDATLSNFALPDVNIYPLSALKTRPTTLGAWTDKLADAALTHLACSPQSASILTDGTKCYYSGKHYHTANESSISEHLAYKFLPDVDGPSMSPRWRALLRSSSLPLKSTIFSEWHDARLVPWQHFVPLAPDMRDWWGVLEYFAGYDPDVKMYAEGELIEELEETVDGVNAKFGGVEEGAQRMTKSEVKSLKKDGHDSVAERIAAAGSELAGQALRSEDMLVYLYRLILEYARVVDDRREVMGWVGDLR